MNATEYQLRKNAAEAERDYRERIGNLVKAIDKLSEAVKTLAEASSPSDRELAEQILDEVAELTASAAWEL